ncbi:MAG: hypothetical protein JW384_01639 [Nitrosomonadaceae bacterium]|nr:hypothetical protein [Nitrosomonadaceae bacterium]
MTARSQRLVAEGYISCAASIPVIQRARFERVFKNYTTIAAATTGVRSTTVLVVRAGCALLWVTVVATGTRGHIKVTAGILAVGSLCGRVNTD